MFLKFGFSAMLALACVVASGPAFAQSLRTGGVAGVISDPTGAVVPNATVNLKSLDDGSAQTATTSASGAYRYPLLKPGRYTVSTAVVGFQTVEQTVEVSVGNISTVNLTVQVGQSTQTIEVSVAQSLINPDPSTNTAFSQAQLEQLPSAGGDITNIAFTAPGVVVNATGGGYGNFTLNGLPATSNLFTVNGENSMDPYFNINNSGATNLTLGQNELQEATVIANAYSGQYGQLSGAQVTYVTKSGTNSFHGNALYYWNGRALNANNWFNNFYGTPKPFSNANQWAASVGGPIRKNGTFFFLDTEGTRFVLPNVISATVPTAAFSNAVLANVKALQPKEAAAYSTMLGLYSNAPGAANAVPIANTSACNSLVLPGFNPSTQFCAAKFQATPTALAQEWILSARVDQKLGDKDNLFVRWKLDHGTQPTYLDPISPVFDALSKQPQWDTQVSETHIFGPSATNSFIGTFSHYVAQFSQGPQALSTFPYRIITSGAVPFTGFNPVSSFPQGRNITQYQFIDDISWIHGLHSFKFGENFRRYDVSDHNFFYNSPAVYYGYTTNGLQNFANGLAYQYRQSLNVANDVPIAMLGLGAYAQDEWQARPNLKVTLALRLEHNGNPVCNFNCFANFNGPVTSLPSFTSANPGSVPYSADIASGLSKAFPGTDAVNWSPRIGFSWSPLRDNKTVVSGGFGIFYDSVPAGLVDDLLTNPPVSVGIRVRPSAGVLPFDPAGGAATWAASANAFSLNKTFTQISSSLTALGSNFAAPAITAISGTLHSQQFQEWNLQVQRQLSSTLSLTVNYAGNHGIHIPYSNGWPNAYDQFGLFPGTAGIPSAVPVPNYGTVTTIQSGAVSNYNGLSVILTRRYSNWFSGHLTYTWSHNIDEVSNGGVFTYGDSLLGQINPKSLRANNYGNSDYDIRNNFAGDFIVNPKVSLSNRYLSTLANGWQLSGKLFWRSGLPFTVTDTNGALGNGGGTILAYYNGSGSAVQTSCGSGAAVTPCINAAAFVNSGSASFNNYTGWSTQSRNQFRGPHLFDFDMAFYRNIAIREKVKLGIGMQAFNLFNHPNFGLPDSGLGSATFGQITGMAGVPTTPYGAGLGFDASPRVIQLSGKITF